MLTQTKSLVHFEYINYIQFTDFYNVLFQIPFKHAIILILPFSFQFLAFQLLG